MNVFSFSSPTSLVRMICVNSFYNTENHCFGQRSRLDWALREKNLLNIYIIRNSVEEKHQMMTFILLVDQLLSNMEQSFIFLFIWNLRRPFSTSVFISSLEGGQEEPPLKYSVFPLPQIISIQRHRGEIIQVPGKNFSCIRILNSVWCLCPLISRLILEWLDSCNSLIDIDLAFKKMGQVLWNKRRSWKPGHAGWQERRGRSNSALDRL